MSLGIKSIHSFYLLVLISFNIQATDLVKCNPQSMSADLGALSQLSNKCNTAKALLANPELSARHKKNTNEKLAEKLSKQIINNLEDMALLSTYFQQNDRDLLLNSKDVASSCQLKKIKDIENCGGNKKSADYDFKIKLLKKNLPLASSTPFENDSSLYGVLAGKFYTDLGLKQNKNTCPIDDLSGTYLLGSQLESTSSDYIVKYIQDSKETPENTLKDLSLKYPQIKLILNTNQATKNAFFNKIKNLNKESNNFLEIKNFLFENNNQNELAKSLSKQCDTMTANVNKFLCSDLEELGSLDDNISKQMFNDLGTEDPLEDQYEVDDQDEVVLLAYGMQCLLKDASQVKAFKPSVNSTDTWFRDFENYTRPFLAQGDSGEKVVGNFCELYSCKNEKVKNTASCSKGGPITAADLSLAYGCSSIPKGGDCNKAVEKSISFIKSITINIEIAKGASGSSVTNENVSEVKKGKLSNFAENFLGVEGSLIALNKPVTPIMISEKKEDFKERNLEVTAPPYKTPEQERIETRKENIAANENYNNQIVSAQPSVPYAPTREISQISLPKSSIKSNAVVNNPLASKADQSSDTFKEIIEELKRLETSKQANDNQLEKNAEEQLANKYSNNPNAVASNRSLKIEEERLRRRARDLEIRSRDLDEYKKELDNRNYRATNYELPRSDGSNALAHSDQNFKDSANVGGSEKNTSSGASAGGKGVALTSKLVPSTPMTEQKPETAAIIQSGKETEAISTEELTKISPKSLEKLGIDTTRPFVLRVNFENKTYEIPVRTIVYKGTNILGPVINPLNKQLKDFLFKGPLFAPYVAYRMERGSTL